MWSGTVQGSWSAAGSGAFSLVKDLKRYSYCISQAVKRRTGMPDFSAKSAQPVAPGDPSLMNARHKFAPSSTISSLRIGPAAFPNRFHWAGCGSCRIPMSVHACAATASAPVGQAPWMTTSPGWSIVIPAFAGVTNTLASFFYIQEMPNHFQHLPAYVRDPIGFITSHEKPAKLWNLLGEHIKP